MRGCTASLSPEGLKRSVGGCSGLCCDVVCTDAFDTSSMLKRVVAKRFIFYTLYWLFMWGHSIFFSANMKFFERGILIVKNL